MFLVDPKDKTRLDEYRKKILGARNFAEGTPGEAWNGIYLMGLAMFNLELIPYNSDITPRWYWVTAPMPRGDGEDWPYSWIAERDAFHGEDLQ